MRGVSGGARGNPLGLTKLTGWMGAFWDRFDSSRESGRDINSPRRNAAKPLQEEVIL
jgi:hypothetical protein